MFLYCHSGSSCCMTISSLMWQDYADISWRMKESIPLTSCFLWNIMLLVHLMAPDCTLDYPGSQWCPARNLGGIPEDIIHCLIKSMTRHWKARIQVCGSCTEISAEWFSLEHIFFVSLSFLACLWMQPFVGWTFSSNDTTSFYSQHITQYLHRNDFFPSLIVFL